MKSLLLKCVKVFSYLPGAKGILKLFYIRSLRKLKAEYISSPEISDILLTSQTQSKSFKYGHSDLNLLIIVSDQCHPKLTLKSIRDFLQKNLLLDLTINNTFIPILTESEYKTNTIKSYLIRKSHNGELAWKSIFDRKIKKITLRKQDEFAVIYNAVQSIDFFLLKEPKYQLERTTFKNISGAVKTLNKFFPKQFKSSEQLINTSSLLQKHFYLSSLLKKKYFQQTWHCLTFHKVPTQGQRQKPGLSSLGPRLREHLQKIAQLPIIDDITVTPTLIQPLYDFYSGKIFLDLHLNREILKQESFAMLEELKEGIKEYQSEELKIRVRLHTNSLYYLFNENALYPFPLEALYRQRKTLSLMGHCYQFNIDHRFIIYASIHFLTAQFMRFRSLEQKTQLIGSKFIKSLNLMYKYYLLAQYLAGRGFDLQTSEIDIRSHLTPQFSEIAASDEVTEEHWLIIQAQLKYFLKQIRNELATYDRALKALKF